jgi:very-short-patch-repair endonuclease
VQAGFHLSGPGARDGRKQLTRTIRAAARSGSEGDVSPTNSNALHVSPSAETRGPAGIVQRLANTIRISSANPPRSDAGALDALWEGLRGLDTHAFRRGCCVSGWPVDLVCVEAALVVQVDDTASRRYSERLARNLASSGYRVLCLSADEVRERPEDALAAIVLQLPVD